MLASSAAQILLPKSVLRYSSFWKKRNLKFSFVSFQGTIIDKVIHNDIDAFWLGIKYYIAFSVAIALFGTTTIYQQNGGCFFDLATYRLGAVVVFCTGKSQNVHARQSIAAFFFLRQARLAHFFCKERTVSRNYRARRSIF